MRLLGATRLSHKTDESTSIQRQGEQITLTAQVRGDTLVHITQDTDVSGAISPFDREDLGPWLTDPDKLSQWDGLIIAKLDRLTRSLSHFDTMVEWCDRNGKSLISVSESLDLSTPTGRMFANLLAMFAQFERERMGERRREAAVKIRENGWWEGGRPPFGYRPIKVEDHWELEVDPDKIKFLYEMANQVISGKSTSSIARKLNEDGIPTASGGEVWRAQNIKRIFTNSRSPLDAETKAKVITALDSRSTPWAKRHDAALLLNVAYCALCGRPLYAKRFMNRKVPYQYYECAGRIPKLCKARGLPLAQLEQQINDATLERFGHRKLRRKKVTPGKSHAAEVSAIERQIHTLDLDAPDYASRHAELLAERARVKNLKIEADKIGWEDTGLKVCDYFPTLDDSAKRQFMLKNKIKYRAQRDKDGLIGVTVDLNLETFEGRAYLEIGDEFLADTKTDFEELADAYSS